MVYEPSESTIFEMIESLKDGLVSYATGNSTDFNNNEYKRVRKILLSTEQLSDKVPDFIRKY